MNQSAAVAVTSDTRSLLNALAATFTNNSTTVLGELLQNARRAGASKVEITATAEELTIVDDGRGIEDLRILLSIAKSGWNDEIQSTESPYGLGFISCLFAAERITVASKGKLATAATADLLNLVPMQVQADPIDGATAITLTGHKFGDINKLTSHLTHLASGFPIPVFLNGAELPRPNAIGNCALSEISTGWISTDVLEGHSVNRFYLQGLPIEEHHSSIRSRWQSAANPLCFHLDPIQFRGRMPDRAGLLEPQECGRRINASVREAIVAHLTQRAAEMKPEDFVAKYADLACKHDMHDLLNTMPFVPRTWLGKYEDAPVVMGATTDSRIGMRDFPEVVSRADIEKAGIFECDGVEDEDDLRAALALHARGCIVPGRYLPEWHWIAAARMTIASDDFTIVPGKVRGEGRVGVYGWEVTVRLCEELHLHNEIDHPSLRGAVPVSACFDRQESVLYLTDDADLGDALKQVSTFEDDERFDEGAHDEACADLYAMLQTIRHNDPSMLVKGYLDSGIRVSAPEMLRGKSFTVAFNEDGVYTVVLAA